MRQLRPKIREKGIWKALRTSKDPSIVILFFEDSAALVGLVVAFLGDLPRPALADARSPTAIASIVIGLLLATVASFLVQQSRGLLLGESVSPEILDSIRAIVRVRPRRGRARRIRSPCTSAPRRCC